MIFGEVGVGGGIVADGRLLRGRQGYAGEFGHMIVEPGGRRCGCGRVGCWETVVGLRALLDAAADPDDPVRDPALGLDDRLAEINRRADLGDTRTLAALDQVGGWVGVGAAILANALNPGAIVLSGYFAEVGRHMRPAIEEQPGRRACWRRRPAAPGSSSPRSASPPPSAAAPPSPSRPSSTTPPCVGTSRPLSGGVR